MLCRFKAFCTALLLLVLTACAEQRQGGTSFQSQRVVATERSHNVTQSPATHVADPVCDVPRVYGVFIGIADYPSDDHDLRYCDQDAERMTRGFRDSRLTATDDGVISLTNGEASYIAVFSAFNALSNRVREQDLFVFFFDGHGNRHEIELYDQVLEAADVRTLLGQIPRGRKLILFDSCEAGGFTSVAAELPRTVGLFASRADEQAQIAPQFGAGGYLAYYVWQELLSHGATTTGLGLFRTIESGYAACHLRRQHVVLAGDSQMLLW